VSSEDGVIVVGVSVEQLCVMALKGTMLLSVTILSVTLFSACYISDVGNRVGECRRGGYVDLWTWEGQIIYFVNDTLHVLLVD
jgi:hypothetical protein